MRTVGRPVPPRPASAAGASGFAIRRTVALSALAVTLTVPEIPIFRTLFKFRAGPGFHARQNPFQHLSGTMFAGAAAGAPVAQKFHRQGCGQQETPPEEPGGSGIRRLPGNQPKNRRTAPEAEESVGRR